MTNNVAATEHKRLWHWLALLLGLLLGLLLAAQPIEVRASLQVSLVLSEAGGIHQQAADAVRAELTGAKGDFRLSQRLADEAAQPADLLVAIGVHALRQVLREPGDTPVLGLLVPRLSYANLLRLAGRHQRPSSALFLDQAYSRQLRLLRAALPDTRRVGVILGPTTAGLADSLEAAAADWMHLEIRRIDRPESLFPTLNELSSRVDALLLVPDAAVVSRATLPSLLLHTYRRRLPVLGYSEALSQAGVLLALYATPAQIGVEAGHLIRDLPSGPVRLPAPHYPRDASLRINHSVARSLGLHLPDSAALLTEITRAATP